MPLGLFMVYAADNLLNKLTDHLKGPDSDDSFCTQYGVQAVGAGLMRLSKPSSTPLAPMSRSGRTRVCSWRAVLSD